MIGAHDIHGAGGSDRFGYSAREQALFDQARAISEAHAPDTPRMLTKSELSALFRALEPLGYLGSILPESAGGRGLSAPEFAAIVDGLSPALPLVGNHSVQRYLHEFGSKEQCQRFMPELLSGEAIGAIAITEPGMGSDLRRTSTTARRTGAGYVINGVKTWVTHGMIASVFIVLARLVDADSDSDAPCLTRFIVPAKTSGLRVSPQAPIGLRHLSFAEASFEDCEVASDLRLGDEGEGASGAKAAFPIARVLAALQVLGIAKEALDLASDYARSRPIAKGRLSDSSSVQLDYSGLSARCEAARLLALGVVNDLQDGGAVMRASAAKALACELALECCYWAADCTGAVGLAADHKLQRLIADARMMAVVDGTAVLNYLVFARRTIARDDGMLAEHAV